jgi:tRNA A-37 threonylcarbamoyl transferase component Bud32
MYKAEHGKYKSIVKNGYTWFLPEAGDDIPLCIGDPDEFINSTNWEKIKRSRTADLVRGYLNSELIYIKRYNYKGIRDTLENIFRKSRARKALEGAIFLKGAGINTPAPLFACEKRILGIPVVSFIGTKAVNALDLVTHGKNNNLGDDTITALSQLIRHLHEKGIYHADLKGDNILLSLEKDFFLIDLDRLKICRALSLRRICKNLTYINTSLVNVITDEKRILFLNKYMDCNLRPEAPKNLLFEMVEKNTKERLNSRYGHAFS